MAGWNPWHGCSKISSGCKNCYVYRSDKKYDRDPTIVCKTKAFDAPIARKRDGSYKIVAGEMVWTCFSSDFLVEEADEWRSSAWEMMRERQDLRFMFITKRIHRLMDCLPPDWGEGYDNVAICCTAENQEMADFRLPIFKAAPIKHKSIACEPLLGRIDLLDYLGEDIYQLVAGGESGAGARLCRYEWILSLRDQCMAKNVPFMFKQTGANFERGGKIYSIPRRLQHSQARAAGINYKCGTFLQIGRKQDEANGN